MKDGPGRTPLVPVLGLKPPLQAFDDMGDLIDKVDLGKKAAFIGIQPQVTMIATEVPYGFSGQQVVIDQLHSSRELIHGAAR